jgi:phosphatidylinositol alpha-1,6-mannosyltransferase
VAFAVYAAAVAIFSGPGDDRSWGIWAASAYGAAAAIAALWRGVAGRRAALAASVTGGLVAPLAWLAITAPPTPDVHVVSRSAALLLRHGTPYLSSAHLGGWLAYNPYLPVMSVFGLPRALGLPGVAGDPRVWLAAVTVTLLVLALRVAGKRDALHWGLFAAASPVAAFPLALGVTDPPVLALVCLALAALSRATRPRMAWLAAIIIGVACAMKYTAWPALPVLTAMLTGRDGIRAAARFAAVAVGTAAALAVAFAPAALGSPVALLQNTVLFPLGLTRAKTPAASPLPGHLLAMTGPAGHLAAVTLLTAAGLAVVISLAARPPADARAAAWRLAVGLALLFALAPASRFGYFAYPAGLLGWLALSGPHNVFAPGADISDEPVKGMRAKLIDAAGAVFGRWTPWVRALPRI